MHDGRVTTVTPVTKGQLYAFRIRTSTEEKKKVRSARKRQRKARQLNQK